jgi:hypothetical protein
VEDQHSHNQRQNQGGNTTREGQPQTLSPVHRQLTGPHIAPVLPDSQNTRRSQRLRTVPLVLGQVPKQHAAAVMLKGAAAPQLSQQTPFALEPTNDRNTAEGNEY